MNFLEKYSERNEALDTELFTLNKEIEQNNATLLAAKANLSKIDNSASQEIM